MAINFLDAITVNSGTGSASTIVATGTRPVTIKGGAIGSVAIGGSNGGWSTGYFFTGYSGTNRGGFGALGSVDTVSYFWIGDAYNDTTMVIQPNAGNVGIGTTSPGFKLDVAGNARASYFALRSNESVPAEAAFIYRPATGVLGFGTSSAERMRIDSSGNVGIGTTNPTAAGLEIANQVGVSGGNTQLFITGNTTGRSVLGLGDGSNRFVQHILTDHTQNMMSFHTGATAVANNERMRITSTGNVGIGTTAPVGKLEVAGNFRLRGNGSGNDSNPIHFTNTAVAISRNDNNLELHGYNAIVFGAATSSYPSTTERMRITNTGNVGIGTNVPSTKLHVKFGVIRVEGAGCGIQMPDTSGNPTLKLVTDQNAFTGCNIINGWGNSSNTGVGIGTTRSDGIAMQVRSGVALSSGFATESGTQRLIVYGSGGTKLTKSLGVGTSSPSNTTGRIDASNDIVAYSSSDIRLKDNIKSIDKALNKVNKIQGIEFDWIEKEEVHGNSGHDVGVIAQEIEKVLPEVVDTRDNGYKAVKYEKIVPLLIEAIKDLSKQVDGLKRLI